MSQIVTTQVARSLDDLQRDRFLVVATREEASFSRDGWNYTIPAIEGEALKDLREGGYALTVTGSSDGRTVLFAKLAAPPEKRHRPNQWREDRA